jgi:hypothetical protein
MGPRNRGRLPGERDSPTSQRLMGVTYDAAASLLPSAANGECGPDIGRC